MGGLQERARLELGGARMRQTDAQIRAYTADSTPTLIVNGKYRLTPRSAGGNDQFIALVRWLVARESK